MQEKKDTKAATQAVKAEVKETAKAVTEAVEAEAKEVKAAAKSATAKKPGRKPGRKPGSTTKKPELKTKMVLQIGGGEVELSSVEERIKAEFVAQGHRAGAIKKFEIYIKPEENMVYSMINDKFQVNVNLF